MIETRYYGSVNVINSHCKNNKLKLFLFFKPPELRVSQALGVYASKILLDLLKAQENYNIGIPIFENCNAITSTKTCEEDN